LKLLTKEFTLPKLGQFTLFAASRGNKVLAVEPFYENIIRIHMAALIERLENKIVLITNGISNERALKKRSKRDRSNIGANGIVDKRPVNNVNDSVLNDMYYIQTILLDDLVDYLPGVKGSK
jgi:hypothetical protein